MIETREEEFWNWVTHGLGIVLTLIGIPFLFIYNTDLTPYSTLSLLFLSGGLLFVYCSSTAYHYIESNNLKEKLRVLDHISIYYLITGSYAPVCFITLNDYSGLPIFFTVLGLSILGTIFKIFSVDRYNKFSLMLYIILGWLIVVDIDTLFSLLDSEAKNLLIAGGIFYSIGVLFYLLEKIKYNHAIWHIFVMLGSISHYLLVLLYVI